MGSGCSWQRRQWWSRRLIALDAGHYRGLLENAPDSSVSGGAIYDAVILACARSAGAEELLTFNPRQFERLDSGTVRIIVPT
jgi:predicted nucleic acid-binding protein